MYNPHHCMSRNQQPNHCRHQATLAAISRIISIMALAVVSYVFPPAYAASSPQIEQLDRECDIAFCLRSFDDLVFKSNTMIRLAKAEGDSLAVLRGMAYSLIGSINRRDSSDFTSAAEYLSSKIDVLDRNRHYVTAALAANAVSLYHLMIFQDYPSASQYSFKALDLSRKAGDLNGEITALSGIASVYLVKRDKSGYKYALESYEKAKESGDPGKIYAPACNVANFHYISGNLRKALK